MPIGLAGGVRTKAQLWGRIALSALTVMAAPCAVSAVANAQVFQTDAAKTPLPQPVGTVELNLCNLSFGYSATTQSFKDPSGAIVTPPILYGQYYAPPAFPQFVDGDEITLAGLFKWRKEPIDPILDAKTAPGHFFPGCGFSAELVLRGGGCSSGLGWYNVTPGSNAPPAASEIYPLVPGDVTYLNGTRTIFTPLGWDNRDPHDLSTLDWTPKAYSSGAIQSDPNYKGGDIAFALVADPLSQCSQNKFSLYEHNVKNSSGLPWVTALIYKSKVDPTGIYLAFEDLPMSAADWHQTGTAYANDGDFNDFVFFISGLGATSACPDPACASVSCGAGTACSGGVCVPSGNGGAGAGGASAGGAGNGGSGDLAGGGQSGGGGATAVAGSAGSAPASSAGSAGDSAVSDGTGGTTAGGETAGGGAGITTGTGGSGTTTTVTNGGCSCRIGSRGATRMQLLWLALSAAAMARRRRRSARAPRESSRARARNL